MTRQAAIMTVLKNLFPTDYENMINTCRQKGLNAEKEICGLIETSELKQAEQVRAAAAELIKKDISDPLKGFEKLSEYARRETA